MDWIKKFVSSNAELKELMDNKPSQEEITAKLAQSPELVQSMMDAFKRDNDPIGALLTDGDNALESRNIQEAVKLFNEALKIAKQTNDHREGLCYEWKGNAYAYKVAENYETAINKSIELGNSESDYLSISDMALICSILNKKLLNFKKERKYLEIHHTYKQLHEEYMKSF